MNLEDLKRLFKFRTFEVLLLLALAIIMFYLYSLNLKVEEYQKLNYDRYLELRFKDMTDEQLLERLEEIEKLEKADELEGRV